MILNYLFVPQLNPIIFSIGPVSLYWYGLMYFLGFFCSMKLMLKKVNKKYEKWEKEEIEYLIYFGFIGTILGGRIGYVLFYNINELINDKLYLFKIWQGGMSFHGGLIGVIVAIKFFSYYFKRNFFQVSDFIIPTIPPGLGAGRLGNFINGELWGRVTEKTPWAMFFQKSYYEDIQIYLTCPKWKFIFEKYGALPRHPSQLYEAIFEGAILFLILNFFSKKKRPKGSISGLFLFFYGIFRVIIEFFRQPDIQIGFFFNTLTLGQILSFPMIISGIIIIFFSHYRKLSY